MLSDKVIRTIIDARERGARLRPEVGGFPYLAECLRQAGIKTVHCAVPSRTTTYRTSHGAVVDQGVPLVDGSGEIAAFDVEEVVAAIRRDQRGAATYDEFMAAIWAAGVVTYDVDLDARTCTYHGTDPSAERYIEEYAAVTLDDR